MRSSRPRLDAPGLLRAFGFATPDGRHGFDPDRPLLFMHVPKCAGTGLRLGLQRALRPTVLLGGFDGVLFDGLSDLTGIDGALRPMLHLSPAGIPAGASMVAGHFAASSLRRAYASGQFVTVLREPVSRLLSLWLFWRGHDDAMLAPWGRWGDHVRLSRLPLERFLGSPLVACQTDNIVVRMLLWPHPLIPAAGFIDPAHDAVLLRAARRQLAHFAFVDVVENPDLNQRLDGWLGQPFEAERANETTTMPEAVRGPLDAQLTQAAVGQLRARSRLDLELWQDVVRGIMPGACLSNLGCDTRMRNVARYATLTMPSPAAAGVGAACTASC